MRMHRELGIEIMRRISTWYRNIHLGKKTKTKNASVKNHAHDQLDIDLNRNPYGIENSLPHGVLKKASV